MKWFKSKREKELETAVNNQSKIISDLDYSIGGTIVSLRFLRGDLVETRKKIEDMISRVDIMLGRLK